MSAWIAVDFDATLAKYDGWVGGDHLGEPIPEMVERVKQWIAQGKTVKIFTARVGACNRINDQGTIDGEEFASHQRKIITQWCIDHIGVPLEVTATKDFGMIELWDDRAVQVVPNTGQPIAYSVSRL